MLKQTIRWALPLIGLSLMKASPAQVFAESPTDGLADLTSFAITVVWHGDLADSEVEHLLEMAVKAELGRAGIVFQQTSAIDFLILDVFAKVDGPGGISYSARLPCARQLALVRQNRPTKYLLAGTWSRTVFGYAENGKALASMSVKDAARLTKTFIDDYSKANKR